MFCELFAFEIQGMTFPKEWLFISLHCNKESSHTQVENGWSTCQRSMKRSPNKFSHHQLSHLWWKTCFDKFFTSHPLSLIWNIVCFNASGTCSSARASACNKIQEAQQLISFQYFCLWLPLKLAACLAFQYFSSNPVGTCENIMKKGLRTVRSFLRVSAQNLGKRRKEERKKHHNIN